MKNYLILIILSIFLTSCRSCVATYEQRRAGVKKVCPSCNFVRSEQTYYAVDTLKKPNVIYRVNFCEGVFYPASEVDELVRVN